MSNYNLKTIIVGLIQTNCYVISLPQLNEAIVIDPGAEAGKIEQYLKANDLNCKAILLTHGHFDHILAADELRTFTHAPVYAHEKEEALLKDAGLNASDQFHATLTLTPDILVKDQQILNLAGFSIRVIHTPGHTGGGVSYYFSGHGLLFSGDTLFYENIGRSDFPTGNQRDLVDSIINKLMALEDMVIVYPGHGEPTTIGYERENNIYLTTQ